MSYSYYQQAAPSVWGTSQYQFQTPPQPNYQPQPSWTGVDYYKAHSGMYDNDVYDYAWNKVRDYSANVGSSKSDAKYWHRQVYAGMGDLRRVMPSEIGAAAAYEAWRSWKSHYSVYAQPISSDRERQREALVAMAIGEAERLWPTLGQQSSSMYGRRDASESAAATANRIFSESWDLEDPYYGSTTPYTSRGRSYTRSRPGTPYGGSASAYGGGGSYTASYDGFDGLSPTFGEPGLTRRSSYSNLATTNPSPYMSNSAISPMPISPQASYGSAYGYNNNSTYGGYPSSYGGGSYGGGSYSPQQQYGGSYTTSAVQAPMLGYTPSSSSRRSSSRHRARSRSRHRSNSYVSTPGYATAGVAAGYPGGFAGTATSGYAGY